LPPRYRSYANVSAFVHATEDEARVKAAILRILPAGIAERLEFICIRMDGHHGNPILELKSSIAEKEDADKILLKSYMNSRLSMRLFWMENCRIISTRETGSS